MSKRGKPRPFVSHHDDDKPLARPVLDSAVSRRDVRALAAELGAGASRQDLAAQLGAGSKRRLDADLGVASKRRWTEELLRADEERGHR